MSGKYDEAMRGKHYASRIGESVQRLWISHDVPTISHRPGIDPVLEGIAVKHFAPFSGHAAPSNET
jgi:hypothetical protein